MPTVRLAPWQYAAIHSPTPHTAFYGGVACVRGTTELITPTGKVAIKDLKKGDLVLSMGDKGPKFSTCEAPFLKGQSRLFEVIHAGGKFVAHGNHLICDAQGKYRPLHNFSVGEGLLSFSENHCQTIVDAFQQEYQQGVDRLNNKDVDFQSGYQVLSHLYDRQLQIFPKSYHESFPLDNDGPIHNQISERHHAQNSEITNSRLLISQNHFSNTGFSRHRVGRVFCEANFQLEQLFEQTLQVAQQGWQFLKLSDCHRQTALSSTDHAPLHAPYINSLCNSTIIKITQLDSPEDYWDITIPETGNYIAEGAIHHNTGKSFTGSHFAIFHIIHHPELTGMIGANNYDQLSQASLREMFYWLDQYGLEYQIDRMPPPEWGMKRAFKSYKNILLVRNPRTLKVTTIFTRVLADSNPLRGVEFSWYWLDETRDTPEITHDVVLSRMRESDYARGIITTTTNGEDWSYERFVKGAHKNKIYGSLHVPTEKSVQAGIISPDYYNIMRASYSPLLAMQELDAAHVNILGGKAYYAASDRNRQRKAPWGDTHPNRERPLIVGCDFNFAPSPFVWMVGQVGPDIHGPNGEFWGDHIHWFGELSGREISTQEMTIKLIQQYPDFFYRIFGDVSGGVGTTSNAGQTDYDQMNIVLSEADCVFAIDYHHLEGDESHANPKVRSRVENMNRLLCNAMGEVRMTYNPQSCPYFDGDMKMVGWKPQTQAGRGKLDDGGNKDRTHASDGAGYAVYKLFPPKRFGRMAPNMVSTIRSEHGLLL